MVNSSFGSIVVNCSPEELSRAAIIALRRVCAHYLEASGISSGAVMSITAATHRGAIFSKFVTCCFPEGVEHNVNAEYLNLLLKAYLGGPRMYEHDMHQQIVGDALLYVPFRSSYTWSLQRGFASSLLLMHFGGEITLPFDFRWPVKRAHLGIRAEVREVIDSLPPLLALMMSAYDTGAHPVLRAMAKRQQIEVYSVGTRLVLALGWHKPSDANYDDMVALALFGVKNAIPNVNVAFFVTTLEKVYGKDVPITRAGWDACWSQVCGEQRISAKRAAVKSNLTSEGSASNDPFEYASVWEPSDCLPKRAAEIFQDTDQFKFSTWILIEQSFLRYARYETSKNIATSLGALNIYLFVYLPVWYKAHADCLIPYPDCPNKLLAGVFVSDLGLVEDCNRPLAFTAFTEKVAEKRRWSSATHYQRIKSLEAFFSYIERFADTLPDSNSFRQSLGPEDLPRYTRSNVTNKRPIPRRIFRFYLMYVEVLIQYMEVVLEEVIAERLTGDELRKLCSVVYIDTFHWAMRIGFIPVVFAKGRVIALRCIPLVVTESIRKLRDGRVLRIPELHGLYHTYVSLHTGIRHQHIQWLDARTYDSQVTESDEEFSKLFVNTDKVKTKPWVAYVTYGVIDTLRKQKAWRDMVDSPAFDEELYYENNPKSKWGKILPLFAVGADGGPTSDSRYNYAWSRILSGVQSLLYDIGELDIKLGELLPRPVDLSISLGERNRAKAEYGANCSEVCEITFKSAITPHSARSSVVSHLITFLPADLIGMYVTGQRKATVHYYVVPDEEEMRMEQFMQARALQRTDFYKQQCFEELSVGATDLRHIKADAVNSVFAAGMRNDVNNTIVSFGCISLSMQESETTGVDVLQQTRFVGAVENKTEICPYGNICPSDVLKRLGGIHKCALCPYAVRHIDHLPAICAKGRQVYEHLVELEERLDDQDLDSTYTHDEIDRFEAERAALAQELTAWRLVEECLEHARLQRASAPEGAWVVGRPEILERDLRAAVFPTDQTDYLLERLAECLVYPTLESPIVRARFDMMRRQILAKTGNIREALSGRVPASPAKECAGLIRSVVKLHKLTLDDLERIVSTDDHLDVSPFGPFLLTDMEQ